MRTYINVSYALVLEERNITDIRTNDFEVIQRTYMLSFAQEVHDDSHWDFSGNAAVNLKTAVSGTVYHREIIVRA